MGTNTPTVDTLINGSTAYACYDVFAKNVPEQVVGYLPCYEPTADKPFVPCCGTGTYCMADNYCYGKASNANQTQRYYMAACTDPTFNDTSACSSHCKAQYANTVWFDSGTNNWECCNWDNLTGTDPSNSKCTLPESSERWSVPAQKDLTTMAYVGGVQASTYLTAYSGMTVAYSTSGTSSRSSSSSSISSASPSASGGAGNGNTNSGSDGLSSGAKIGIGIGIGIGGALLLAAISVCFMMRKRRKTADPPVLTELGSDQQPAPLYSELSADKIQEMDAPPLHELSADHAYGELPEHSTTPGR